MDNTLKADFLRHEAVDYIKQWIGTPYQWAGQSFASFDCSGLIVEVLRSVGLITKDLSANGLYKRFKEGRETPLPYPGCLVFWFYSSGRAKHVAMIVNKDQIVDASGGGSKTKTRKDAIKHEAFVKIRRLNYRGTNYKIIDPFKDWNPDENL